MGRWASLGAQMTARRLGMWRVPDWTVDLGHPTGVLVLGLKRAFKGAFAAELYG